MQFTGSTQLPGNPIDKGIMRFFVFIVLTGIANLASGAIYYVDSSSGKDQWSGRAPTPNGMTEGPWMTLARVSSANLQPGDTVLLKCDQIWHEPLTIKSSGTATKPISIGAYPMPCISKPTIEGSAPIPRHSWVSYSGNIYKAALPLNLIANSAFSSSFNGWTIWSPVSDASISVTSNCASQGNSCMSFTSGTGTGNSITISNSFALNGGAAYELKFSMKAPVGTIIRPIVRRRAAPWDTVGISAKVTGTGSWQTYSLSFNANTTLANARLDFEVPPGRITIGLDDVRVEMATSAVLGLFSDGHSVNIAHHPNRGFDPQRPQSVYLSISENSNRVSTADGKTASTYLTTGSDLVIPQGGVLKPGTVVRYRADSWYMEDRKISTLDGPYLHLDQPSTYPISKGWGYFLIGDLWMLDEPGEWHYDATTQSIYIWMPDGSNPSDRVSIGTMEAGIDVSSRSHLVIDGIAVRATNTGVNMQNTTGVTIRNISVSDTLGIGINALLSTDSIVESCELTTLGTDAISAASGGLSATRLLVTNNSITESGVRLDSNSVTSIPVKSNAAIRAGKEATVSGNRISATGYIGILPLGNSLVSNNFIHGTCLVLDDCGAIYLNSAGSNSQIEHNLISHSVGGTDGKPPSSPNQAQGIYIDEGATGVDIIGNTVLDAENGIKVHDASNNHVQDNTLYGNRRYQLLLQEQTNIIRNAGDLWGNQITMNRFFPTSASPSIGQESVFNDVAEFASYNYNRYSTLLSTSIASEQWASGSASYSLPAWQAATSNGIPRNLDPNGTLVSAVGYAPFLTIGGNLLPNGNFTQSKQGWTYWNEIPPGCSGVVESCQPGMCLHFSAGASASLLTSPNFPIQKDRWYRVTFDLKTGGINQPVSVVVRRGGGGTNPYELLVSSATNITGTTQWRRFSFVFKAGKTLEAYDPITRAFGPRIDFQRVQPGQELWITNLEVIPLSAIETSLRTEILTNASFMENSLECPNEATEPALCTQYLSFTDGTPITWPRTLGALDSEIIYSVDRSLTDADGDGIADSQDACPATPAAQAVNSVGCSFDQSYR